MKDPDLSKVSTPRTARVLMQKEWKRDMLELAQQLELENGILRLELKQERELNARLEEYLHETECRLRFAKDRLDKE